MSKKLDENRAITGNAAALREALAFFVHDFTSFREDVEHGNLHIIQCINFVKEFIPLMESALAKPPRNCDVGTPEEQARRFDAFCDAHHFQSENCCADCPCHGTGRCEFKWGQLPYEGKD